MLFSLVRIASGIADGGFKDHIETCGQQSPASGRLSTDRGCLFDATIIWGRLSEKTRMDRSTNSASR